MVVWTEFLVVAGLFVVPGALGVVHLGLAGDPLAWLGLLCGKCGFLLMMMAPEDDPERPRLGDLPRIMQVMGGLLLLGALIAASILERRYCLDDACW